MTKIAKSHLAYERRQIVAKCGNAGNFTLNNKLFTIPLYMTFYTGKGSPAVCGKFDRLAPMDKYGFLRLEGVQEGEIVVDPALVYKITPMTGMVMAAHLKAMAKFKPKEAIEYVKDEAAPAVDMGAVKLTKEDIGD